MKILPYFNHMCTIVVAVLAIINPSYNVISRERSLMLSLVIGIVKSYGVLQVVFIMRVVTSVHCTVL